MSSCGKTGCACGDIFRFDACDILTGRVKARLHPIHAEWEEVLSEPGNAQLQLATRDLKSSDIWPGLTSVYISRIGEDGDREGLWGGYIQQPGTEAGEATRVGLHTIDEYLFHRLLADPDKGLHFDYPDAQQTEIAAALVSLMTVLEELYPEMRMIPLTSTFEESPVIRSAEWYEWDLKNIGQAIKELTEMEQGVEYRLLHTFADGKWSSVMEFRDQVGENRNLILRSDVDAHRYGIEVDGEDICTRAYGVGAGEEDLQLLSVAYDPSILYPEFQAAPAWKDAEDQETLDALTQGYVANHRDPSALPAMAIPGMDIHPSMLQIGDTVKAQMSYGWLNYNDDARVKRISWSLDNDENPVTRTLDLLPVLRPAVSVLGATPGIYTPASAPTPKPPKEEPPVAPPPPNTTLTRAVGLVSTIDDVRIDESSSLVYSPIHNDLVFTSNDEDQNPQIYGVRVSTGATGATIALGGLPSDADPEAMQADSDDRLWLADIGNNSLSRTNLALYRLNAVATVGNTVQTATKYPFTYDIGPVNSECFLIKPSTQQKFLIQKHSPSAGLYQLPTTLSTTSNIAKRVKVGLPANVTDGCFTNDSQHVLLRIEGEDNTWVLSAATWTKVGEIPCPIDPQSVYPGFDGESITMEPDGLAFLIGSEGLNSPLIRVMLPAVYGGATAYQPPSGSGGGSGTTGNYPASLLNLLNQKLTLPTPLGGGYPADEVTQPKLKTFVHPQYFHLTADKTGVVFQAPVNGARTSENTDYPRSETREMVNNGRNEASWDSRVGIHSMTLIQAITMLPGGKDEVVAGQIHDDDDDVIRIMLAGKELSVRWDQAGNAGDGPKRVLDTNYQRGTKFKIKIVAHKGGINVAYTKTGGTQVNAATIPRAGPGMYFKYGCYTQANTSNGTGYGEVVVYGVEITHG